MSIGNKPVESMFDARFEVVIYHDWGAIGL